MPRFHELLPTILFIAVTLFFPYPASAVQKVVVADFSSGMDQKGVPSGWELKERSGKADISIVRDGSLHALRLRSNDTSFSIQKPVDVTPHEYPLFTWKWKVTRIPEGGDFRKPRADDQAAQLFLAFSNSNIIVYIWDSSAPQGADRGCLGASFSDDQSRRRAFRPARNRQMDHRDPKRLRGLPKHLR